MLRRRGLVMMPVSEAGLVQINENANALFGDPIERSVNHFAAIAASRSENIAERTSRVHAHQNIFLLSDIAANKREMTLIIDSAHILNRLKNSRIGLETPFAAALDKMFGFKAVANQLGDGNHFQPVNCAELGQMRNPGHGAVRIHDFANHAARLKSAHPSQIHRRFRLPRAN